MCEWKAKRKKAAGGLSTITSSLHLVLEARDTEAPREVIQNNHVMISNGGITDSGGTASERGVLRQRISAAADLGSLIRGIHFQQLWAFVKPTGPGEETGSSAFCRAFITPG